MSALPETVDRSVSSQGLTFVVSLSARLSRALSLCSAVFLWTFACSQPKEVDDVTVLINAIKNQDWQQLNDRFGGSLRLEDFSVYRAMREGARWRRLARIRRVDHHLLFDLELTEQERGLGQDVPIKRFMFWVTEKRATEEGGPRLELGELVGSTGPIESRGHMIDLSEIRAPTRFATTSFRDLNGHQFETRIADFQLGVIGEKGSGAIEEGWRGTITLSKFLFSALVAKDSKRCKRLKEKTVKRIKVLKQKLNQRCEEPLLLAAQRSRYLDLSLLSDKVDISKTGGGREIRARQDEVLLNRFLAADQKNHERLNSPQLETNPLELHHEPVSYNGVLSFSQAIDLSSDQRLDPTITEAILISPPLVSCVKDILARWSKDFLKRSPCRYQALIHVKVDEREE